MDRKTLTLVRSCVRDVRAASRAAQFSDSVTVARELLLRTRDNRRDTFDRGLLPVLDRLEHIFRDAVAHLVTVPELEVAKGIGIT